MSLESKAMPARIVGGIIVNSTAVCRHRNRVGSRPARALRLIVALDASAVTDNAGGKPPMSGMQKEVRHSTDALDAVGNTTRRYEGLRDRLSQGLGIVLLAAYSYV